MAAKKTILLILLVLALRAEAPFIRIIFPNGGEVLKSGSRVRILWQSLGVSGNVAILLFKSGEQYAVLAESTPNSGAFAWIPSSALAEGDRYRLRICALADLRINDFSDRDFSIKK